MPEPLLTTREISKRLRVDVVTVRRWTREGRLPCLKMGRKTVRYNWPEVQATLSLNPGTAKGRETAEGGRP